MAQAIEHQLRNTCKALGSNPSAAKQNKTQPRTVVTQQTPVLHCRASREATFLPLSSQGSLPPHAVPPAGFQAWWAPPSHRLQAECLRQTFPDCPVC
jgi:hypothetical protein